MKLKALLILALVSASAFAEPFLNEAQSIKLYRANPYAQVQPFTSPIYPNPSGLARVLWRVSIPAEIGISDSCLMNAALFQNSSESIITLPPGPGIVGPGPQPVSVRDLEVKGVAISQPGNMCTRLPQPLRRLIQLSLTFSKEDQIIRLLPQSPPYVPPAVPAPLYQYVSIAGQIFQVRLQPAPMGTGATVQMIPMGPPPAPY